MLTAALIHFLMVLALAAPLDVSLSPGDNGLILSQERQEAIESPTRTFTTAAVSPRRPRRRMKKRCLESLSTSLETIDGSVIPITYTIPVITPESATVFMTIDGSIVPTVLSVSLIPPTYSTSLITKDGKVTPTVVLVTPTAQPVLSTSFMTSNGMRIPKIVTVNPIQPSIVTALVTQNGAVIPTVFLEVPPQFSTVALTNNGVTQPVVVAVAPTAMGSSHQESGSHPIIPAAADSLVPTSLVVQPAPTAKAESLLVDILTFGFDHSSHVSFTDSHSTGLLASSSVYHASTAITPTSSIVSHIGPIYTLMFTPECGSEAGTAESTTSSWRPLSDSLQAVPIASPTSQMGTTIVPQHGSIVKDLQNTLTSILPLEHSSAVSVSTTSTIVSPTSSEFVRSLRDIHKALPHHGASNNSQSTDSITATALTAGDPVLTTDSYSGTTNNPTIIPSNPFRSTLTDVSMTSLQTLSTSASSTTPSVTLAPKFSNSTRRLMVREESEDIVCELEDDPEISSTATYTLPSSHFVSTTFVSSTSPITIRLSFPTTSHSGAGRMISRFHGVTFWLGIVSALIIIGGLI